MSDDHDKPTPALINPRPRRRPQPPASAAPAEPSLPKLPLSGAAAAVPPGRAQKPKNARRAKRQPTGDYAIGNCRPPKHGQIQPGEIRNPRGRASGAKGHDATSRKLLSEKIPTRLNGRERMISARELLQRKTFRDAVENSRSRYAAYWLAEARRLFPDPDTAAGPSDKPLSAADQLILDMLLDGLGAPTPSPAPLDQEALQPVDPSDESEVHNDD